VLQVVFSALVMAGQLVGMTMGLGFATLVDPQNGIQVPVVSRYYVTLASLLFLALDGHLALFSLVAESFRTLPVAPIGLHADDLRRLALWGGELFAGGVLVGLPVVVALLLANLVFGVITRAAPQLNIFAVGFPATLALGFAVILFALPGFHPEFARLLGRAFAFLGSLTGSGHG
ncbi:MAG: flagellar biosynthetic protein FliR, partial [Gammaproteobacteria bacterium]